MKKGMKKRFMEKVRKDDSDGCWIWTGSTNNKGQPIFSMKGRMIAAHRVIYSKVRGPIPDKATVLKRKNCDKLCVNPRHLLCVNPRHLEPGTFKDQSRKGVANRRWGDVLTQDIADKIRSEYFDTRVSQKKLAAKYGVSNQHISDIVRSKYWNG